MSVQIERPLGIRPGARREPASGNSVVGGPEVLTFASSAGRSLLAFTFTGTCLGLVWAIVTTQGQFFLFGMLACFVVTIPLSRPGYAVLGPWSLLVIMIYISCGVRGFFISLDLDGRHSVDGLFLLGRRPGYFVEPSVLYVAALALLVVGYMWRPHREAGGAVRRLTSLRLPPMVGATIVLLAIIGFVAFVLYMQRTGGLSAGLSMKRTTINGVELDSTYRSHGELRFINTFSAVALWLHVARRAQTSVRSAAGGHAMTAVLLANAMLLPIYASARSEVGYIALVALAIHYGVVGRLPRGRTVLKCAALVLVVLTLMTGARVASQGNNRASADTGQAVVDSVSEVLVYNRNFGDMQTTAHIVHAVPVLLPVQHGKTITAWLAAPIPRAVWPEKPLLQSGPIIGEMVYGNVRSGVPPGFVAEMYWNFMLPGVLVGSLLLGLLLAFLREAFVPYLRGQPAVALVYAIVLMRLGAYVFTGGVGSGIFKLLTDLVCLMVALALARLMTSSGSSNASRYVTRTRS